MSVFEVAAENIITRCVSDDSPLFFIQHFYPYVSTLSSLSVPLLLPPWYGINGSIVYCMVKKNDSNVFYRSHLKLVSQSYYRELISCQGSGAHWKLKKSWAASISLDNNLLSQIYFPRADYDREQSPLIISETTQHNAT